MNWAQIFMLVQVATCLAGAIAFILSGKPWGGSVWFFYALANIGWFQIARGLS